MKKTELQITDNWNTETLGHHKNIHMVSIKVTKVSTYNINENNILYDSTEVQSNCLAMCQKTYQSGVHKSEHYQHLFIIFSFTVDCNYLLKTKNHLQKVKNRGEMSVGFCCVSNGLLIIIP